jgi:hypothetical protein
VKCEIRRTDKGTIDKRVNIFKNVETKSERGKIKAKIMYAE